MNTKNRMQIVEKYILYLLRWQFSSPILALVLYLLHTNIIVETIIANLIGGIIFFWIDRKIFKEVK
jgi:putative flippase GtrA